MLEEIRGLKADLVSVKSKIVTVENRCNACIPKEDLKKKQIEDQRKLNVMLEGVPETQGERVYQICQDLFTDLGCIMKATVCWQSTVTGDCPGVRAVHSHVLLLLQPGPYGYNLRLLFRYNLFDNIAKLHTLDKWNNTRISPDLSPKELSKCRDVRAVHALAKSKGIDSRLKGVDVVVEGTRYTYEDILTGKLTPRGITFEAARTRATPDGLAYTGPHSPLSNLCPCRLTSVDGSKVYSSVEHWYAFDCPTVHGNNKVLERLKTETNQYEIKQIHATIKPKKQEWLDSQHQRLMHMVRTKFQSHDHLKAKLIATKPKGYLYEATLDEHWGCGKPIHDVMNITQQTIKGKNEMGEMLMKIRAELLQ